MRAVPGSITGRPRPLPRPCPGGGVVTRRVLDLFAGIRGWSHDAIGLEQDADACATAKAAGYPTVRADVMTYPLDPLGRVDGFTASPPCQTFSAAGNRDGIADVGALVAHVHACATGWRPATGFSDPRTALVLEPLRYALQLVPEWLALEQVPDVLPIWDAYAYTLRASGWSVWTGILNAADYGVPQTRRRAILMAHRRKIVHPPVPTHCEGGALTMFGELAPWVSMADALGWTEPMQAGFPRRDDRGDSPDGYRERDWRSGSEPTAALTEKARSWKLRHNQDPAPTLTGSALGAGAGATLKLHTNRGQDADGSRQLRDGDAPAPALSTKAGGQWAFTHPATAVCGDPRNFAPVHHPNASDGPDAGSRNDDAIKLTVADALTLQSFPPDYPVRGTKTSKFRQIGNAIPPGLARAVVDVLVAS